MSVHILDLLADLFKIYPKKVSSADGGKYHSPCPGCGGKDRFIVWTDQNDGMGGYWCNQCSQKDGKPKDNVQFLVEFKGMEYPEAFAYVGRGGGCQRSLKTTASRSRCGCRWG